VNNTRKTLPTKERFREYVQQLILLLRNTNWVEVAIFTAGITLALLIRYSFRAVETQDYEYYFKHWYVQIQEGGFQSLGENFSNYPPLYLCLLYLVSLFFPGVSTVTAIKIPSIFFDFICAWYIYKIIYFKYGKSITTSLSFLIVLFAPTVILNGAYWGQIESIYTAALLACVYYLLKKRNWLACIAFGLAFAIKLQSIYLAPLLLILWLKRNLYFRHLLAIPAIYLLSILPAWIAGRPILDLLTIYSSQASNYEGMVHNATSVYTWLPFAEYTTWYLPGVFFALGICLIFILMVIKSRIPLLEEYLVKIALASVLLVPFFLPKTHDRYFYPADVFSIVFGFYYPRLFIVPLIINLASFFIYQPYLFGVDIFPQSILTLAIFIAILIVIWNLASQLYPGDKNLE
jgi:Gpi18-like mannosyltransferase